MSIHSAIKKITSQTIIKKHIFHISYFYESVIYYDNISISRFRGIYGCYFNIFGSYDLWISLVSSASTEEAY